MKKPVIDERHIDIDQSFIHKRGLAEGRLVCVLVKYRQSREALIAHRQSYRLARKKGRYAPLLLPLREEGAWHGGFIALMPLAEGGALDLSKAYWQLDLGEVRGFTAREDGLAVVALVDALVLIDLYEGRVKKTLHHPLFRNLHSVSFCPWLKTRVLISNTGLDSILEMDLEREEIVHNWRAWDHGYHRTPFGFELLPPEKKLPKGARLLRHDEARMRMEQALPLLEQERCFVAVDDLHVDHVLGLEKWLKSAEPNWAGYDPKSKKWLASFFVSNQAVMIDPDSGAVELLLDNLSRPHAVEPTRWGYAVSDTRKGEVILIVPEQSIHFYNFSTRALTAPDKSLDGGEWLQYTSPIAGGNYLASVDSRRAQVIIWSPEEQCYTTHSYPHDWSMHAIIALPDDLEQKILLRR
ncbi:hypothetical protein ACQZV8_08950 [Magnetococcales bacterium HHB-1]